MNNTNKGKQLEDLIKTELSKVVKSPYNLVDNNLREDPYINQLSIQNRMKDLYNDKSFIRGDFLIYNSLTDIVMIDSKNYKNKGVIEKTVDVNKALIFLNQNVSYINELGNKRNKLQDLIYRPEEKPNEIESIGEISKDKFVSFISFLEHGTIHHHSSKLVDKVKIKKYFIYQINNESYAVCSFKELNNTKINISIKNTENTQKIIFKQNNLFLCELNSSHNHMTLHHHESNMMNTEKFKTLNECIVYIESQYSFKTKDFSYDKVLDMIEKKEVVSKKTLAVELMLKNVSLQTISKLYEQIDKCKNVLSLSEKYISID